MAGFLTDKLGRWRTIVLTDVAFIVGGAVLFAAQDPGKQKLLLKAGPVAVYS